MSMRVYNKFGFFYRMINTEYVIKNMHTSRLLPHSINHGLIYSNEVFKASRTNMNFSSPINPWIG